MCADVLMVSLRVLLITNAISATFCTSAVELLLAREYTPAIILLYVLLASLDIMDLVQYPYLDGMALLLAALALQAVPAVVVRPPAPPVSALRKLALVEFVTARQP